MGGGGYSEGEQLLIEKGKVTVQAIMDSADLKVLESGDPLVTLKAAHLDGDALATGIAESVVDGQMEEVAAFECLKMSREATKVSSRKERSDKVERIDFVSYHHHFLLTRRFAPRLV